MFIFSLFRTSCNKHFSTASTLNRFALKEIKHVLNKPKLSPNAYALYYEDQFKKSFSSHQNSSVASFASAVAEKWKSLDESTKQARAEEQRQRSLEQTKQFKESLNHDQRMALRILSLTRRAVTGSLKPRYRLSLQERAFVDKLPKAPFSNGRTLFISKHVKGVKSLSEAGENLKKATQAWLELNQSERQGYEQEAKKDQERYRQEIKALLS